MNKKQKRLLYLGLGLFVVPEIILGLNFGLFTVNKEFVSNADNNTFFVTILLIQFIGVMTALLIAKKNPNKNVTAIILLSLLAVWVFYNLYISFAATSIWS